jgi:hypothetical protein
MKKPQTTAVLFSALLDAAKAHGVYEGTELAGVHDENWPEWYADHMTRTLSEQGYEITRKPALRSPSSKETPA